MLKFKGNLITFLLTIIVLLIFSSTAFKVEAAKNDDSKVVKVGLTNWAGFGPESDGELFRSYSFDYFEKLKEATGLNFKYSNYTWDEALKLLEEKKIDAVLGASYTDNRASKYAFIYPSVIKKNIDILALKKVVDFKAKDIETDVLNTRTKYVHDKLIIKGKVFGIIGNFDHKYENILKERAGGNTKVIIKKFNSNNSLKEALLKGEIDYIIAGSYISPDERIEKIETLTKDEFYLVANIEKENLINKLSEGILKVQKTEGDNKNPISKYSGKSAEDLVLTSREKKLLNSLDKLTFYILKGNKLYYQVENNGIIKGFYSKYIPKIANVLNKDYEVVYVTIDELKNAQKPGFYFDAIRNYNTVNEAFGTKMLSKPIIEKQMLFYENMNSDKKKGKKVYVSYYPSFIKEFSESGDKVIRAKDDRDSLKILTENKADIALIDYSMEYYINSMLKYKDIKLIGLESDVPISILVVNTKNEDYLDLINKAIDIIPSNYLKLSAAEDSRNYTYEPTIVERIKSNVELFIGGLFLILIIGFVVIKILISKNKKIELLIEDTNKNNSVKDDFLSRVSHDMRTPLNAIINYSDFGIEEQRNKSDVSYFQKIKESSYNLLNLMKDVLELQRLENSDNNEQENNEVLHIGSIFAEIKTEIKELARKKKIHFSNGFKFNTKNAIATKYAKVNKKAIRQVISNILYNAIKYTPSGGEISWNVELQEKDNAITVTHIISDNGIGIGKDFQKNMYNAFTVGDNKLTNNSNGTGLGLAIAVKAVEILGGTIKCRSEVGKGTTFTINFLLKIPSEKEIKEYEEKNRKLKLVKILKNTELTKEQKELIKNEDPCELQKIEGKKVLICEDAKINALIIEKILSKYKMNISWAENGIKGLELAKNNKFDLILMDIKMPLMDGLCATSEIRKIGIRTPIIGLSGSTEELDVKKALAAGMNDYLEKPINKSKLLEKILQYVIYLKE